MRFILLNMEKFKQLEPLKFTELYRRLHSLLFHTSIHTQCCVLPISPTLPTHKVIYRLPELALCQHRQTPDKLVINIAPQRTKKMAYIAICSILYSKTCVSIAEKVGK